MVVTYLQNIKHLKRYTPIIIAGSLMFFIYSILSLASTASLLQIPSGYIASFFLGAPISFSNSIIQIQTIPPLTVSIACSGIRLFSIIAGLGGGYWCRHNVWRWLILLPLSYIITLFSNAARIVVIWQFRRFSNGYLPDWVQEFCHMGIGIVCSLTIILAIFHFITNKSIKNKEPIHDIT